MKVRSQAGLMSWLGSATLIVAVSISSSVAADDPKGNASKWRIKDIYEYLSAAGEDLSDAEIDECCTFIRNCQNSKTGSFEDKHGTFVYSVKADSLLNRYGFKSRYSLSVCEPPYRIRAVLVRATGLATLSREKTKEIEKAKHEQPKSGAALMTGPW